MLSLATRIKGDIPASSKFAWDLPLTKADIATRRLEHVLWVLERSIVLKGDAAGHEFHGNQWSASGQGKGGVGKTGKIYRAESKGAAMKYAEEKSADWRMGLTPNEMYAISNYTADSYYEINTQLRNEDAPFDSPELRGRIAALDSALAKSSLPERMELVRQANQFALGPYSDNPQDAVGHTLTDSGFVSTSLSQFGRSDKMPPVRFVIDAPAGAPGAPLDGMSSFESETEVLLPRDSKFRVTGYSQDPQYGTHILNVRYIPPSQSNKEYREKGLKVANYKNEKGKPDKFTWEDGDVEWDTDVKTKGEDTGHEFRGNQYTGGGGGKPDKFATRAGKEKFVNFRVRQKGLEGKVSVSVIEGQGNQFIVAGVKFHSAAEYDPNGREIRAYDGMFQGGEQAANGMLAHEMQHAVFHDVTDKLSQEASAMYRDPDPVQGPGGTIKPEYAERYPASASLQPYLSKPEEAAKWDGITEYSSMYWKGLSGIEVSMGSGRYSNAVNETLAEVARLNTPGQEKSGAEVPSFWQNYYNAYQDAFQGSSGG